MFVLNLSVPSRTQAGDMLIAYVQAYDSNDSTFEGGPWNPQGQGWRKIYEDVSMLPPGDGGTTHRPTSEPTSERSDPGTEYFVSPSTTAIFQKTATGPGPSQPFSNAAGYAVAGAMLAYTPGVTLPGIGIVPLPCGSELGADSSPSLPSVTAGPGDLLLGFVAVNGGGSVNQSPMTRRVYHQRTDLLVQAADELQPAGGPTGARAWPMTATPGAGTIIAWKTSCLRLRCSDDDPLQTCLQGCEDDKRACLEAAAAQFLACLNDPEKDFGECVEQLEEDENECKDIYDECIRTCFSV